MKHLRYEESKVTTIMQFNIDGYPSDSPDATQFFGTEAEKLGVTLLLLQDTRRTEYSGTALTRNVDIGRRQQQRRQNTKEERWVWRHEERIKEIQIGGVTTGMTERLHRWVGHDKDHKPAVIKQSEIKESRARNIGEAERGKRESKRD